MRNLAVAALVLLAACSGGETAAGTTTTTAPAATVGQYASVVAEWANDDRFLAGIDMTDQCSLIYRGCTLSQLTTATSAGLQAVDLANALRALSNPDRAEYVGSPPDEIASLVDRTVSLAGEFGNTMRQFGEHSCESIGNRSEDELTECARRLSDAGGSAVALQHAIDGWSPYL